MAEVHKKLLEPRRLADQCMWLTAGQDETRAVRRQFAAVYKRQSTRAMSPDQRS